jgi:hypothetical protein
MRVEVLDGVERRRRWSREDKARIVEETLAPGVKLIFYSTNSQAIERTQKSAPEKRLGTTFRVIWRDWDQLSPT